MTAFEAGSLLLLLGSLLSIIFLGRAWCVHAFSLGSVPATATGAHRVHVARGRHILSLATAGAAVYVGRQLAPVVLAVAVGAMFCGATLRVVAS